MMIDAHCHFQNFQNLKYNSNDLNIQHLSHWFFFTKADSKAKDVIFNFNSTEPKDWKFFEYLMDTNKQAKNVFYNFGLHPWKIGNADFDLEKALLDLEEKLQKCAKYENFGIGEIGLDFAKSIDAELQEKAFFQQLVLAAKYNRSVSIHCVRACQMLFKNLKKINRQYNQNVVFMVHSFNGSVENLDEIIKLGGYVSFSPKFSDNSNNSNNSKFQNLVLNTPNDKILLESDFDFEFEFEDFDTEFEVYFKNLEDLYAKVSSIKNMGVSDFKKLVSENFQNFINQTKN